MNKILGALIIFLCTNSCKISEKKILISSSEDCNSNKELIQIQFDRNDYDSTITLFKNYKDCFLDELIYFEKLGLLYKINEKDSLSSLTFDNLIDQIDKENLEMNRSQIALYKARIYLFQNKGIKAQQELKKIDRSKLSRFEKKELKSLESFTNIGNFIAVKYNIEFEIFE